MSKWADFVITAVKYDSDYNYIQEVKRSEDDDSGDLKNEETKTRNAVINAIKKGMTYCTATKNSFNKFDKGSQVKIVKINGTEYIKTKENDIERDNLENLPEF